MFLTLDEKGLEKKRSAPKREVVTDPNKPAFLVGVDCEDKAAKSCLLSWLTEFGLLSAFRKTKTTSDYSFW
jgi:hypothetical protein